MGGIRIQNPDGTKEVIPFPECSDAQDFYDVAVNEICLPEGEGAQIEIQNERGEKEDYFMVKEGNSINMPRGPMPTGKKYLCVLSVGVFAGSGFSTLVGGAGIILVARRGEDITPPLNLTVRSSITFLISAGIATMVCPSDPPSSPHSLRRRVDMRDIRDVQYNPQRYFPVGKPKNRRREFLNPQWLAIPAALLGAAALFLSGFGAAAEPAGSLFAPDSTSSEALRM